MIALVLSLLLAWDSYGGSPAPVYVVYTNGVQAAVTTNTWIALPTAAGRYGLTVIVNGVESLPAELTVEVWQASVERAPAPSGPWTNVVALSFPVVVTNETVFYRSVLRTDR